MAVTVRSRGLRVVRGLLVASLSVVVAAFSHVAGGGAVPGALGTILALAFAILACIALSSRALSPVRLSISVACSQFVFHLLFSLGANLPAGAHASGGMFGMVMSGGASTLPDFGSVGSVVPAEAMSDARMWLGHAIAAVVTVAVLLHGERSLLLVARLGAARLALLAVVVDALPSSLGVARHGVAIAVADLRGLRPLDVLLASRPHRGPPAVA